MDLLVKEINTLVILEKCFFVWIQIGNCFIQKRVFAFSMLLFSFGSRKPRDRIKIKQRRNNFSIFRILNAERPKSHNNWLIIIQFYWVIYSGCFKENYFQCVFIPAFLRWIFLLHKLFINDWVNKENTF